MNLPALLQNTLFFKGICEKNIEKLASICIAKNLKKKETLFCEGQKGFSLYLVARGSIMLTKSGSSPNPVVIKVLGPGELFAEVILFEQDHYPVTATALKESLVYLIPKHQFFCLLNEESFRNDFIRILMRKQRYLVDKIRYMSVENIERRLLFFLQNQFGRHERIAVGISKKDVASALGTTAETLSRTIRKLQTKGKFLWHGGAIYIDTQLWNLLDDE